MPQSTPHLVRRGHTLHFRLAIPIELHPILGRREFTKALKTSDHKEGTARAFQLASQALSLFQGLRTRMGKKSGHSEGVVKYGFGIDLNELGYPTKVKVTDVKAGEEGAMRAGIKGG